MKFVRTHWSVVNNSVFFALCASLLALSHSADAQQSKRIPRIGYLSGTSSEVSPNPLAFRQGLRDLGYTEGKNILVEYRSVEGKLDRAQALWRSSFDSAKRLELLKEVVPRMPALELPRIGYLTLRATPSELDETFKRELRELGYIEGQNIAIEYRWAAGNADRLATLAEELVHLNVDIIIAFATPAVNAAKNATKTIPIVMAMTADPVRSGLVGGLAQAGGNITGMSLIMPELSGKRIELLKEILPKLSRVAFLAYGPGPGNQLFVKDAQESVQRFGMQFESVVIRGPDGIEHALSQVIKGRVGALVVHPVLVDVLGQGGRIAELAKKNRLPTISDGFRFAEVGGLIYYGPDYFPLVRRAAFYVDKIMKGTKPGDLPVEQPRKFELVINLNTSKQIGITIPPHVLARADRVIK